MPIHLSPNCKERLKLIVYFVCASLFTTGCGAFLGGIFVPEDGASKGAMAGFSLSVFSSLCGLCFRRLCSEDPNVDSRELAHPGLD